MKRTNKTHVHVMIDAELWERSVPVIREMGFTQSGFFELMLKRLLQAETVPMAELIGEVLKDVLNAQIAKKEGKK